MSSFLWGDILWTFKDAVINFCRTNTQQYYSKDSMTPIFQGHRRVTVDYSFKKMFPSFKWLVVRPNPLITQPAEGIRSNNFSEGNGWSGHIWTTSACLCSNKEKLISKMWAKSLHSGSSLWGNWKPKNGFTTFGYLFDWHNTVTSKVFSFSKNEISSILANRKMQL